MEVSSAGSGSPSDTSGRYRIIANLGRGGMAAIHLAVIEGPSGFHKLVVLKRILPEYADKPGIRSMFLDEARLAARLNHPNVVQTNEVGFEDETPFLTMEYLDGQPLTRVLQRFRREGGLPLAIHLQVIADLLAGLHHAHELADYDGSPLGVVHCDVSPHNTFITYDGIVKVVDFGVARARTALTQTPRDVVKGKLAYMAPEQMRGDDLDRRADIFAVGVMLWEAATGKRPWRGVSEDVMVENVLLGRYPAPCVSNPDVPVELEAIILKALSFEVRSRYATAAELQSAIEGYLDDAGGRLAPRDLGKLISMHFADERAVLQALIQEQLQAGSSRASRPPPVPFIVHPGGGDTPTLGSADGSPAPGGMGGNSAVTIPDSVGRRMPSDPPPRMRSDRPVAARRPAHVVPSRPADRAAPAEPAELPAPRSSDPVLIIAEPAVSVGTATRAKTRSLFAAAVALILGVAGGVIVPRAQSAPMASRDAGAAPSVSTPAKTPDKRIELRLAALPAQARFFLDDVPLEGNPYRADVAPDALVHRVRVEAPGFVPRIADITLDRNTLVDIELVSDAPPAPLASAQPREVAPPRSRNPIGPRALRITHW